jgi:hypothetical protein
MSSVGPFLVFALLAAPALRLLGQAGRTRQTPEIWAGLYFLCAAIGLPMRLYGASLLASDPDLAGTLNTIGHVFFAAGTVSMTIFTWRVFHPGSRVGLLFALATIATICVTSAHTISGGHASDEDSISMLATNAARLIPTYWACLESLRYWLRMRRREALGLADPVVTNRFLLWAIWTGALSALPSITLSLRLLAFVLIDAILDIEVTEAIVARIVMGLRGVFLLLAPVAAVSLSLSFFPPAYYVERIRSHASVE